MQSISKAGVGAVEKALKWLDFELRKLDRVK
jgi:hypothetical protein